MPFAGMLMVLALAPAAAQGPSPSPISDTASAVVQPSLTAAQIVSAMQDRNLARAAALKHFHSIRHYSVEYRGYAARIAAQMEVEADYDVATGKTFRIVSQKGSKLLCEKVLKRLVESETEVEKQHSAELDQTNYRFTLAGQEIVDGRPAYVLDVEPLTDNKYLYRGKVWVDAEDFALERIEAAPAKNPSFWISSTAIHHRYDRAGGFWLPAQNESDTDVRVGGKAVLKIDYGKYEVTPVTALVAGGN